MGKPRIKRQPKFETPLRHVEGLAVGVKKVKGFKVTKRTVANPPSRRRGRPSETRKLVKGVIREVCGFAPYERRIMELLRNGLEKRALKLSKRKLGGHHRGIAKKNELTLAIKRMKAQQQKHKNKEDAKKKN